MTFKRSADFRLYSPKKFGRSPECPGKTSQIIRVRDDPRERVEDHDDGCTLIPFADAGNANIKLMVEKGSRSFLW